MFTRNFDRRIVRALAGSFGLLALAAPSVSASQLIRPVEADAVWTAAGLRILVTDAGQPGVAGTGGVIFCCDPNDPNCPALWVYGPSSGPGALKDPSAAEALGNGEVAIADTGNHRVLIVNSAGQIVWNSATVTFSDGRLIRGPVDVQIIPDGTPSMADNPILIACRDNNRVAVVKRTGQVLWAMNSGLSAPLKAERLANGNTLIIESQRVIEANAQRQIVASLTPTQMPAPVNLTDAERLADGSTLVLDGGNGLLSLYGPNGSFVSNIGSSGQDGLAGAKDVDVFERDGEPFLLFATPDGVIESAWPDDWEMPW